MTSHFLHATEGIGQVVGVTSDKLFTTTNDAVAIPLVVNGKLNELNLKQGLVLSVITNNPDCVAEVGDPVTFWEQGNSASGASQTFINVAGKCMNCENPCPFSVNSLSEKAKDINVRTKRIGIKNQMSRKNLQSICIDDNGEVTTTASKYFEV